MEVRRILGLVLFIDFLCLVENFVTLALELVEHGIVVVIFLVVGIRCALAVELEVVVLAPVLLFSLGVSLAPFGFLLGVAVLVGLFVFLPPLLVVSLGLLPLLVLALEVVVRFLVVLVGGIGLLVLLAPEVLRLLVEARVVSVEFLFGFESSVVVIGSAPVLFGTAAERVVGSVLGLVRCRAAGLRGTACFEAGASGIVLLAGFFVLEDVIGVGDVFEYVFMAWILVRVVLLCEFVVSHFHFLFVD